MQAPIIRFYDDAMEGTPINQILFSSTVNTYSPIIVGTESVLERLFITNNVDRGIISAPIYDATNCRLEIRDVNAATYTSVPIREQWLSARNILSESPDFTPLGGANPNEQSVIVIESESGTHTISGDTNNGDIDDSNENGARKNTCILDLKLHPPVNTQAESGSQLFDLYLSYSYGTE